MMFASAGMVEYFTERSDLLNEVNSSVPFLVTLYTGGVTAFILAVMLIKLLWNIYKGVVFDVQNVKLLRRISWCCAIGAIISFISMTYYLPWCFVGIAAGFMCLLVRVIKNIIAEACLIKSENDYTI